MTSDQNLDELAELARAEGEASEATRARIVTLRARGYTLRALATSVGCDPKTIANICERAREART